MVNLDVVFKVFSFEDKIYYFVLIFNFKGLEVVIEVGVKEVVVFGVVFEFFLLKNINCFISESLKCFEVVFDLVSENKIKVRGYVLCVMGCFYEGKILFSVVI